LPLARYEDLLPRPLDEVRRALGIAPASEVHPEGVIVANGPGREHRGVGTAA